MDIDGTQWCWPCFLFVSFCPLLICCLPCISFLLWFLLPLFPSERSLLLRSFFLYSCRRLLALFWLSFESFLVSLCTSCCFLRCSFVVAFFLSFGLAFWRSALPVLSFIVSFFLSVTPSLFLLLLASSCALSRCLFLVATFNPMSLFPSFHCPHLGFFFQLSFYLFK